MSLFQNSIIKKKNKIEKKMCKDYQPPVDSDPEEAASEVAPPPKPDGDDDGEGADDAGK